MGTTGTTELFSFPTLFSSCEQLKLVLVNVLKCDCFTFSSEKNTFLQNGMIYFLVSNQENLYAKDFLKKKDNKLMKSYKPTSVFRQIPDNNALLHHRVGYIADFC